MNRTRVPAKFDAVVIGSGVAGLAAAVTLAEGGGRVIIFEKRRALGGTSNFLNGIFAVESDMQRERYVTYSCDEAFRNIMEFSHWRATRAWSGLLSMSLPQPSPGCKSRVSCSMMS
jgi:fumarate reductase flavoprotein subunit